MLFGWMSFSPLSAHANNNWGGSGDTQEKFLESPTKDVYGRPLWFEFNPAFEDKLDSRQQFYVGKGPNGSNVRFYLINYVNENKANLGRNTPPYFLWYVPMPLITNLSVTDLKYYDMRLMKENLQNSEGTKGEGLVDRNYSANLKVGVADPWGASRWGANTGFKQLLSGPYKGKYYEWRYAGYAQEAMAIPNPYFIPDVKKVD